METLLIPQKSAYLKKESLLGLHQTCVWWLSELEFCKTEFSFLNKLLDRYFLRMKSSAQLAELAKMEKRVRLFRTKTWKIIHTQVVHHEHMLTALDENMFAQDEQYIRDEHQKLMTVVQAFMDQVRELKKEIFRFVESEVKIAKAGKK